MNRQTDGWNPQGIGPNLQADRYLDLAKRRLRDLVDNNPLIAGAQSSIRGNVVGKGIDAEPDTGFEDLDGLIKAAWKRYCLGVDPERKISLAQSQGQCFDELFAAGEVLCYFPSVPSFNGFASGPAIELVDCDRLDLYYNFTTPEGNRIRQSVEFDSQGRVVAFWVLKDHPRDNFMGFFSWRDWQRIPATDAGLAFRPRRPRQVRGVPWAVSTLETCNMEAGFNEAYLLLARVAACVSVFIEGAQDDELMAPDGKPRPAVTNAADGSMVKRLIPGLVGLLKKGVKPQILNPQLPPPTFGMTTEVMQRRLAAGLGISYAVVARDYSKATFSATRAESLEDRKGYRPLQDWIVHHHTRPLYRRFVNWAIMKGVVPLTDEQINVWISDPERIYNAMWLMPGWEWVNPLQEATATQIQLEAGITDLITVCAELGCDWREVLERQYRVEVRDRDRRKQLGLPPAQRRGVTVNVAPAQDPPPQLDSKDNQQ